MSARKESRTPVRLAHFRPPLPSDAKSRGGFKHLESKERFSSGYDEDWPVGKAPIDITVPRLAVARTTEEIGMRNTRGKGIDVHELLKREAFGDVNDLCDNHFEKSRPCPDAIYGISDQYMVLDSFEMVEESQPQHGMLKWNFMVQGVTGNQRIGVKDKMDTIIEIQIGAFNIPKLLPVPYVVNPADGLATSALPVLTANGTATLSAFVAGGVYANGANLATALQAAINGVPGISGFTVVYDGATGLFTITDTVSSLIPFSILWATGPNAAVSASAVYGFDPVDMTGSSAYTGETPITVFPVTVSAAGPGQNNAFDFNVDGAPSTDTLTSPLTQIPFCNRITVQMFEMGLQSYSDRNGARHHFEMEALPRFVQTDSGLVDEGTLELRPLHDWDTYVFTDPIKSVDGLTMIFRNPDFPVSFPPSCLFGVQAQVAATGQFLQFNAPNHGLMPGDRIFINNFTSGNLVIDNYVNRKQGQIVGVGGLTADSFRLNPDVGTAPLGLALGAPIVPSTRVFSILWESGPSAATSSRGLFGFNDADSIGKSSYTSDATFSLLWSSGPNAAVSARVALGFAATDMSNLSAYTGSLPIALLWGTGPNAATSIRQHLSLAAQNQQGGTRYPTGTFSILWGNGPNASASCRGLYGFTSTNSTGSNTYTGTIPIASTILKNVPNGAISPVTGLPIPNIIEQPATYVVAATNNQFDFSTGGPTTTAVIAPGTYTTTQLATVLQTAINTVSDGFAVTYNPTTSLYTVTRQGPFVVAAGVNDAFDFQVTGGPVQTATVPPGSYSATQFASAIQAATLTALPASPFSNGITVTFIPATNTFSIARGGGTFTIVAAGLGQNNAIDFSDNTENGATHSAFIPAGVYSGTGLAVAAQAAMNAVGYGYLVRFDTKLSLFTISRPMPAPDNLTQFVVAGVNDAFDWMETSVKTIKLTAGSYSPTALAKLLQDGLNAASRGYSVAYNPRDGRYTISRQLIIVAQTTVCIAKNRIRIPLRLRRVIQRLTNYIAP
jgi:hypothetical protein